MDTFKDAPNLTDNKCFNAGVPRGARFGHGHRGEEESELAGN